jgi:hypothetical protein
MSNLKMRIKMVPTLGTIHPVLIKTSLENLNVYSRSLKYMMPITWENHISTLMSVKKLPKH